MHLVSENTRSRRYSYVVEALCTIGSAVARVRKLTLLGLSVSEDEDPYELWSKEKFVESMSLWPTVENDHILCYFVERSGGG